jgi:S-adenosylmethionine-diacylglycerol 3-amino-3-carboxypropyl transferase
MAMADFLELNEVDISQFILLDHQDWMAAHLPLELEREWKAILMRSSENAKMLMRSAGITVDFIPDFVHEKVHFDDELAREHHLSDRVGTYASMHIGTYKS